MERGLVVVDKGGVVTLVNIASAPNVSTMQQVLFYTSYEHCKCSNCVNYACNSYRMVESAIWDTFFELFLFSDIARARSAIFSRHAISKEIMVPP